MSRVLLLDRNAFKVYWTTDDEEGSSHTLVAPDEHTKRQEYILPPEGIILDQI